MGNPSFKAICAKLGLTTVSDSIRCAESKFCVTQAIHNGWSTEIQDGGQQTGSGNNFSMVNGGAAIPTSTPIFSGMPDSDMTLPTVPGVVAYRNSRWRPSKPEMEITFERNEFAT